MMIRCESCGATIGPDDLNLATGLARCRYCNTVFTITPPPAAPAAPPGAAPAGAAPAGAARPGAGRPGVRPQVPLPEHITCSYDGDAVVLRRSWFTPVAFFLIFFCIAWDSFLVFWYSMAFSASMGGAGWIMVVFPVAHVAVGVGLTYFTIATFVNKTVIRVSPTSLSVAHGPLPWPGSCEIPSETIAQVFTRERRGNENAVTYELHAVTISGQRRKLLSGLSDIDQALYVEQEIEAFLGLPDRPVADEVSIAGTGAPLPGRRY